MGLNGGYSGFRILREGLSGNRGWRPAWRDPSPQPAYDFVIVGGDGHGLATAYYLASQFGEASVAVLEKGWIGGGNVGRNTTIIRSNYLLDGNQPFYEFSLKLWKGWSRISITTRWSASAASIISIIPTPSVTPTGVAATR